jgi:hypothetical protein
MPIVVEHHQGGLRIRVDRTRGDTAAIGANKHALQESTKHIVGNAVIERFVPA